MIPQINDIPFGSRAIESGIEVDGIWISRSNTPAPSKRASSATVFDEGSADYAAQCPQGTSSTHNISPSSHTQASIGAGRTIESGNVSSRSALLGQHATESTVYDERDTTNLVPSSTLAGRYDFSKTKRSGLQGSGVDVQSASNASLAVANPVLADLADPISEATAATKDLANTKANLTATDFESLPAFELHGPPRNRLRQLLPSESQSACTSNRLQKPRPRKSQ